jgi:polysaccharide export outer membrane protein
LLIFMLLAGCARTPPLGLAPDVTTVVSALPTPDRTDMSAGVRPYYLGPYDKIDIDVFGLPDMKRTVQVDASGNISFPLSGSIKAAGVTPAELAATIEERLQAAHVRNPNVSVNLQDTLSQTVTVDGSVTNPGAYPVVGDMTLVRAVARAGGATEMAKLDDVVIFRNVGGKQYAGLYNLAAIRRGNYADPQIYANDVVIVGESAARRLFREGVNLTTPLLSPLILLLRG